VLIIQTVRQVRNCRGKYAGNR